MKSKRMMTALRGLKKNRPASNRKNVLNLRICATSLPRGKFRNLPGPNRITVYHQNRFLCRWRVTAGSTRCEPCCCFRLPCNIFKASAIYPPFPHYIKDICKSNSNILNLSCKEIKIFFQNLLTNPKSSIIMRYMLELMINILAKNDLPINRTWLSSFHINSSLFSSKAHAAGFAYNLIFKLERPGMRKSLSRVLLGFFNQSVNILDKSNHLQGYRFFDRFLLSLSFICILSYEGTIYLKLGPVFFPVPLQVFLPAYGSESYPLARGPLKGIFPVLGTHLTLKINL